MQEINELHRDDNNSCIGLVKNAENSYALHVHIPLFAYESAYERMCATNVCTKQKNTFDNYILQLVVGGRKATTHWPACATNACPQMMQVTRRGGDDTSTSLCHLHKYICNAMQ